MKNNAIKNIFSRINPLTSDSMIPTLIIVYILMVVFFAIQNPLFITFKNFQSIFSFAPIVGIIAIGFGTVLLSGNVDLSVGALAATVAGFTAVLLRDTQLAIPVIIIICILFGILIGAVSGFFTAYIGINSIIVTLGMWTILQGVLFLITRGLVSYTNKPFQVIAQGDIFGVIPNIFCYLVVSLVIMYIVLRFTKFGRYIYLIGADTSSARIAGINIKNIKFFTFLVSGGLAAIAGILFTSFSSVAVAYHASGWEFKALTICIVGGISLSGGRGSFIGLFFAWLILGSLSNGLTLANVPISWRDFFEGIVLVMAIIIDSLRVRRTGY